MSSTHDPNRFGPLFQTRRQMLQTVAGAAALTAAGPLLSHVLGGRTERPDQPLGLPLVL